MSSGRAWRQSDGYQKMLANVQEITLSYILHRLNKIKHKKDDDMYDVQKVEVEVD